MVNSRETTHARWENDVAQLNQIFQERQLFVSTIKVSLTHRLAFLMFHEGRMPLAGVGVAIRGLTTFEGEVLRAGPYRFTVSESTPQETGSRLWIVHSDDNSFRIAAEEIQVMRDKQPET